MQLRPPRKEAPQAPERNDPSHGRTPHTPDPRTPRNHHRNDHTPDRYAPPRGSDLDVQVEVEIGCRRVEVGLKLRSRAAAVEGR